MALRPADVTAVDAYSLPPEIEVCNEWSDDADDKLSELWDENTSGTLVEELVARLIQLQRPDGRWGEQDSARAGLNKSDVAVTSAAVEALCIHGVDKARLAVDRAIGYLRSTQRADGSWGDAPSAKQIQATSFAISGLVAAGVTIGDDAIAAGANWLIVHQRAAGGWGDSCHEDEHGAPDQSAATPTAWVVMALVAAGKASHRAARRGVEFLLDVQDDEGRWSDPEFVHPGEAADPWFHNDLHSVAWSLLALSRWAVSAISAQSEAAGELSLRLVCATVD